MNLKDFVNSLDGNSPLAIIVWRDNCQHNKVFMRKDNVIKSPMFNQYADIEVNDYTNVYGYYIINLFI